MEEDISTWRKTGHFYFALTEFERRMQQMPQTPGFVSRSVPR